MVTYYKPWYYTASHYSIGFLAVWFPIVGILALVYQLGQLIFDVRVFPVEGKILSGNSFHHTTVKLSEIAIGYLAGTGVKCIAT
jgi:hypothetical protein